MADVIQFVTEGKKYANAVHVLYKKGASGIETFELPFVEIPGTGIHSVSLNIVDDAEVIKLVRKEMKEGKTDFGKNVRPFDKEKDTPVSVLNAERADSLKKLIAQIEVMGYKVDKKDYTIIDPGASSKPGIPKPVIGGPNTGTTEVK